MGVTKYFVRKNLPHQSPAWVGAGKIFFITICATKRETLPLLQDGVPQLLLDAAVHYHGLGRWWTRMFLVMPDHVHGLVAVPSQESLRKVVASWKSYTAKATGISWQQDFFDHRPRNLPALEQKELYILANPARRGLVKSAEDWPWIYRASQTGKDR